MDTANLIKRLLCTFQLLKEKLELSMNAETLHALGFVLISSGVLIIVAAVVMLLCLKIKERGTVKGGGVIIIGPIPIVFGTDRESVKTILILSIALTIILITAVVILHFMSR